MKTKNAVIKLIAGVAAVLLLTGIILVLKFTSTDSQNNDAGSQSGVTSKLQYEKGTDKIVSISIKNTHDSFTVMPSDDGFVIPELDASLPANKDAVNAVAEAATKLVTQKIVEENAADTGKYGLSEPTAEITVEFSDKGGMTKTLLLGNTLLDESLSYFCFKGENTVYAVKTADFDKFTVHKNSFLKTTVLDIPENTGDRILKELTITRSDLDYPIKIKNAYSPGDEGYSEDYIFYDMISPFPAEVDEIGALCDGIFGLTASSIDSVHPTNEQLEAAGINSPSAVIEISSNGGSYTLTIGARNGSSYYGMFSGIDMIYCFSAESLPWLTADPMAIASPEFTKTDLNELKSVTVSAGGASKRFDVTSDEEDKYTVTMGGKSITEDSFKDFFNYLKDARGTELWLEEPLSDKVDVSITYLLSDGTTETVEFYNTEDMKTIIKHDGFVKFKCRTSYVETLIKNLGNIENGEDIIKTW